MKKHFVVVEGRGGESEKERMWEMVKVGRVFLGGWKGIYRGL